MISEKYKQDRDIPDSVWNRFMQQTFGNDYVVFRSKDKVWNLKCHKTQRKDYQMWIRPYSLVNQELHLITEITSMEGIEQGLVRQDTAILRKLKQSGVDYEITQRGSDGMCVKFPISQLSLVDKAISLKRRQTNYRDTKN